jgi:putative aldouronate transport system substrate-binding protein
MRSRTIVIVAVLLSLFVTGFAVASAEPEGMDGEPVAVNILMQGGPQPPDADLVFEAAKEYAGPIIGAYPVIEFVGWDNWPQRKRLLLQAGEQLDIVFTASWSDFATEVARNAWIPLEDLIDEHAPRLRDAVGLFLDGGVMNGHVYAVPTVKEQAEGTQFIFNKALVDKYNVPVTEIKSFDDLEPWLQLIKENEPDIIPYLCDGLSTPSGTAVYHWDAVAFGRQYYRTADGSVKYLYLIDEVWDYLAVARRWYLAGYFQPEIEDVGSNATAQLLNHLGAGDFFAWSHVSHPGKVPEQSAAYDMEMVGSGPVWQQMVTKNILNGSMDAISVTSDRSVEAIKILELMNIDQQFNNLLNFGIEGQHFEFVDQRAGIIRQLAPRDAGEGYAPNMQWALQNQFLTYLNEGTAPDKWEQYQRYNDAAGVWPTVGFYEDLSAVSTQVASVDAVRQQYEEALFRGLVDPVSGRQEFEDALVEAGVHDVEAEVQRQLDAFLGM